VSYEFANQRKAYFFSLALLTEGPVTFRGPNNWTIRRALIGHNTTRKKGSTDISCRYWHFGLEGTPLLHPLLAYAMKYRVAFSDDGRKLWPKERRSHRARRSVTKDWWNAELRDRMLAVMSWLCDGRDSVVIPVGSRSHLRVSAMPLSFTSPVRYSEPGEIEHLEESFDDDDEEVEEIGMEHEPPALGPNREGRVASADSDSST